MKRWLFVVVLALAMMSPVRADWIRLDPIIINLPGAPATLSYCGVMVESGGGRFSRADVTFTDTQPTALKVVRVRFEWQDAFGERPTFTGLPGAGDAIGTFTQGAKSGYTWREVIVPTGTVKYRCSIIQTLSADGSVWKAPIVTSTPAPPAPPAPPGTPDVTAH